MLHLRSSTSLRFTRRRVSVEIGVLIGLSVVAVLLLIFLAMSVWGGNRWIDSMLGSLASDPAQRGYFISRIARILYTSRISLLSTAIVITAMRMSTRPFGWWRWASVMALPLVFYFGSGHVHRGLTSVLQRAGMTDGWHIGLYANFGVNVLASAIVAWLVSSRTVLLAGIAAALLGAANTLWIIQNMPIIPGTNGGRDAPPWHAFVQPALHAVIASGLILWALRQRALNPIVGMCAWCGYDLRGGAHARCPECGAGIPAAARS